MYSNYSYSFEKRVVLYFDAYSVKEWQIPQNAKAVEPLYQAMLYARVGLNCFVHGFGDKV